MVELHVLTSVKALIVETDPFEDTAPIRRARAGRVGEALVLHVIDDGIATVTKHGGASVSNDALQRVARPRDERLRPAETIRFAGFQNPNRVGEQGPCRDKAVAINEYHNIPTAVANADIAACT